MDRTKLMVRAEKEQEGAGGRASERARERGKGASASGRRETSRAEHEGAPEGEYGAKRGGSELVRLPQRLEAILAGKIGPAALISAGEGSRGLG